MTSAGRTRHVVKASHLSYILLIRILLSFWLTPRKYLLLLIRSVGRHRWRPFPDNIPIYYWNRNRLLGSCIVGIGFHCILLLGKDVCWRYGGCLWSSDLPGLLFLSVSLLIPISTHHSFCSLSCIHQFVSICTKLYLIT